MNTNTNVNTKVDLFDLGPACRRVAGLVDGIRDEHLTGPTPCPAYTVREMLGHLVGLTVAFRDAARKELGPTTDTAPGAALPVLVDNWRELLPGQLDELAAAWRAPEAWQGATRVGGVDLPGAVTAAVALNEVLIHGWDLARSTGQEYAADEASLQVSYGMLAPAADAEPAPEGPFGPPIVLPPGAPLLDRVIGLSGRDPGWRPA
ncbi:TIGR03086 family protein [Streptomyces sp. GMY02]|uniref:TIGR03086 family metal-binding protein n=1 Tax=Streptomyces sp. GMY02 TaxID=1333528 RepID=UPI001C2CAB6C|nr:TIGR03086 family metal-binding protein [Streptomyces sp. GMY02]QXE34059.1 TIGR03086 family protein [Streptomyces sp. GMY02]